MYSSLLEFQEVEHSYGDEHPKKDIMWPFFLLYTTYDARVYEGYAIHPPVFSFFGEHKKTRRVDGQTSLDRFGITF